MVGLWIPAFAGMTGEKDGRRDLSLAIHSLISGGCLDWSLDSRFRGNDGREGREKGFVARNSYLISGGWLDWSLDSRFRGNDGVEGRENGFVARDSYLISGGCLGWQTPRLCQNQDLRDYRIFRILPSRLRAASAHPYSSWRDLRLWRKGQSGRGEILKIPPILKILILTKRAVARRVPRHSREGGNPDDFSQDCCPKSSMNRSQWLHSTFMGEG